MALNEILCYNVGFTNEFPYVTTQVPITYPRLRLQIY